MKVSREQMATNRRKILDTAGRLFREKGFAAVSVADVMKASGQTHGGFYGHFRSKDDLIAEALARLLAGSDGGFDLHQYIDDYLSPLHRDNAGAGCPTAALAAETSRQAPAARAALTAGLRTHIDRMSKVTPGSGTAQKRRVAIGTWAAMVGAMILARASDDPDLSNEVLKETRAWIDD